MEKILKNYILKELQPSKYPKILTFLGNFSNLQGSTITRNDVYHKLKQFLHPVSNIFLMTI